MRSVHFTLIVPAAVLFACMLFMPIQFVQAKEEATGELLIQEVVVNDSGGTKHASDFSFQVNGGGAVRFDSSGANGFFVSPGIYAVTAPQVAGYATTFDGCSTAQVAAQGITTCTITSDDIPGACPSGTLIHSPIRLGAENDSGEVQKLQHFLNSDMSAGLPETGYFGPLTEAAVKRFQQKYAADILTPWGLTAPTGAVLKTTLAKINAMNSGLCVS